MALRAISSGGFVIPRLPDESEVFDAIAYDLDTADEKLAQIFQSPVSDDITQVKFLIGSVTVEGDVDVRIETVSVTTGDPTGTLADTNSNIVVSIVSGDANSLLTATLTGACTLVRGTRYALVFNAESVNTPNVQILYTSDYNSDFPYLEVNTGSWSNPNDLAVFAYLNFGGTYYTIEGLRGLSTTSTATYNNTDTPDEIALKFTLPFPARIRSAWVWTDGAGDFDLVLYDKDDAVLLSTSHDKDQMGQTSGVARRVLYFDDAAVTLNRDQVYRLSLKPTSVTDIKLERIAVAATADMDSWEGGQDFVESTRTDAGGWSDSTTTRPMMAIEFDAFTPSGPRLVHGGLVG